MKWVKWSRRGGSSWSSGFSGSPVCWLCQHPTLTCCCSQRITAVNFLCDRQARSHRAYFLLPAIVSSLRRYLPSRNLSCGVLVVFTVNPPQNLKAKINNPCPKVFSWKQNLCRSDSISWNVFAFPSLNICVTRPPECLYQVLISLWSTLKYSYVTISVMYEFHFFLRLYWTVSPATWGRDKGGIWKSHSDVRSSQKTCPTYESNFSQNIMLLQEQCSMGRALNVIQSASLLS